MTLWAGPVWRDGQEREGWVRIEAGRVTDEGEGAPARARPAVILDGLHDYHTHVGDAFLRGRPLPRGLDELVRPGTGYKHRMLARASRSTIESGVRRTLGALSEAGTRTIVDFREQGIAGVRLVRSVARSVRPDPPRLALLGRPLRAPAGPGDLEQLLEAADGIGLSALSDVGEATVATVARACRARGRPWAIHASEARREDLEVILSHRPSLLVHLCAATAPDLRRVRDAGVPVAVCPSSNRHFRLRPPLRELFRLGIPFFFGTDNAMLGAVDLLGEARLARRLAPGIPEARLFEGLTTPPEKSINRFGRLDSQDAVERVVVLPRAGRRVRWGARRVVGRR